MKPKTILQTIGILLIIFGMLSTIPILQSRKLLLLAISAFVVVIGVIMLVWSFEEDEEWEKKKY